jgi:phage shock protein E
MTQLSTELVEYGLMGLVAAIVLKRVLTTVSAKRKIPSLLKEGAVIVDVRSPGEFSSGNAAGSRNIPLGDLERGAKDLDPNRWIIVCCASGTRSGMARRWLLRHGFLHVLNGGSWRNLP